MKKAKRRFMPINRSIHLTMGQVLKVAGFKFHEKRSGDCVLGYWVLTLKHKTTKSSSRRFVVVPGFGDTPLSWAPVMTLLLPVLKRRYDELVLVDFPGFFGFLNHESPIPSMDLLLQNFGDLMDSLKPHTLFGHSLGGWLSAHYAASVGEGSRPAAQGKKTMWKGPELLFLAVPSGMFSGLKDKLEWQNKFKGAVENGFESFRANMFHKEPKFFGLMAREFGDFFSNPEIRDFILSVRDDHLLPEKLHQIRSKVWLIWAEHDKVAPVKWVRPWIKGLLKRTESNVEAVVLKETGHSLQMESPIALSTIVGHVILDKELPAMGKRWWVRL